MNCIDRDIHKGANNQIAEAGQLAIEACSWNGEQTAPTLTQCNAGGGQRMQDKMNFNCVIETEPYYIVRRLTPTECARLQGMPDWWCADVPHADSAEYKMWGNGMALPCVLYIMEGIKACEEVDVMSMLDTILEGLNG